MPHALDFMSSIELVGDTYYCSSPEDYVSFPDVVFLEGKNLIIENDLEGKIVKMPREIEIIGGSLVIRNCPMISDIPKSIKVDENLIIENSPLLEKAGVKSVITIHA